MPHFYTAPRVTVLARPAFVEPAKAQRLGLISPETLAAHLAAVPPAAVLLGFEDKGEEPLVAYAQSHGFIAVPLPDSSLQLWLAPLPTAAPR